MKILGDGRQAFLEFLRNLTPQMLLLAVILPMWVQLDFHEFDISNWPVTLTFFGCTAILVLAVIANALQFLDSYLEIALKEMDKRMSIAKRRLPRMSQRLAFLLRQSRRSKWKLFFHFGTTFLVVQAGVMAAAIIGIRQAIQLWD